MDYYPDCIADDDDDDISSRCSVEIEGGVAAVDQRTTSGGSTLHAKQSDEQPISNMGSKDDSDRNKGGGSGGNFLENKSLLVASSDRELDSKGECHEEDDAPKVSRHADRHMNASQTASNKTISDAKEQKYDPMAALIQNERNRRLGIRGADHNSKKDTNENTKIPTTSSETAAAANSGAVWGNIRGWFGGVGAVSAPANYAQHNSPDCLNRKFSSPLHEHGGNDLQPAELQLVKDVSCNEEDEDSTSRSSDESSSDDDSDSASHSSNASNDKKQDADLTPQERARVRALRHLSNSCVDARRKAKTASYVWGLERLDLERKRDKYAKELKVIEVEMNEDRGLINAGGERDAISAKAAELVRELPRIQGADAGAGSDRGKDLVSGESFMSFDEYANAFNNDDSQKEQPSLWENKEAVDVYVTSLQGRLKEALERMRSLEKRMVVLEQAGDDIVSSLCEDLAEVTGHSNKLEAGFVKKGKEMQRKRRREEMRYRSKIKEAERHIQLLEEQLMCISGGSNKDYSKYGNDTSNGDPKTARDDENDEDNEILLEKKLLSINGKNDQDKEHHGSEVDSIQRQCEQLKLRLSVARLVMEGDDNLREYIALLERFNPSTPRHRNNSSSGDFKDKDFSINHQDAIPPPPPSHITRVRAKLLKVTHIEHIYEQRLAVSKAFTDATINALEQELSEREQESQMMEVKCLNDLVKINLGNKDTAKEASDKMTALETDSQALQAAIDGILVQKSIADINDMFGNNNAIESFKSVTEKVKSMDNEPSSDSSIDKKDTDVHQVEIDQISYTEPSQIENGLIDDSETSKPATEEAIPVVNESSSERLIDEINSSEEEIETGHISCADSRQVEVNVFGGNANAIELLKPVAEELIPMDNAPSSDSSIDEKDDDVQQVETGQISDAEPSEIESGIVDESRMPKPATKDAILVVNVPEPPSERLIDNDEEEVETGQISDADSCQVENNIIDECDPSKLVVGREYPMANRLSSERSTDENDSIEAQVETGPIPDADSCQVEKEIADESQLLKPATVEAIPVVNEASSRKSTGENDNIESQVETFLRSDAESFQIEKDIVDESEPSNPAIGSAIQVDNHLFNENSLGEGDNEEVKAGPGSISDAESFQAEIENGIVDESSLSATPQNSCDLIEKVTLFAANKFPYKNEVCANHGVEDLGSSDEATRNGDHANNNSGFSFSKEIEDYGSSPPPSEELDSIDNDFVGMNDALTSHWEAVEIDDKHKDVADGVATQCKPRSECSTDQVYYDVEIHDELSATESTFLLNGEARDVMDLAANCDHMSDGKNKADLELPSSNTDTDLRSGGIIHNEIFATEVGDKKEEKPSTADPQKHAVVEMLGRELKYTLAEYQSNSDLSSSRDRIEQLEYMNDLVLKIAKTQGIEIECSNSQSGESELKSWSLKKMQSRSPERERHEKKPSKKKKKKRRRRGKERREVKSDGPDDMHEHSLIW